MTESEANLAPLPRPGFGLWLRTLSSLRRRSGGADASELGRCYLIPVEALANADRYARELGFVDDPLPLSYLYLPAQRAHLGLMLDRQFPYPLVGMVHAGERWQRHSAIDLGRPLQLTVDLRHEPPSRSGACFVSLRSRFTQDESLCAEAHSSYLARRGQRQAKAGGAVSDAQPALPQIARYELAPDAGRRYARLSGDWNPIHLWPWSARLFGFRRPIIHGMHSLARCLALLQQHHGRRIDAIEVRFQAPITLPAGIGLHADGAEFELWAGGRVGLRGSFTFYVLRFTFYVKSLRVGRVGFRSWWVCAAR